MRSASPRLLPLVLAVAAAALAATAVGAEVPGTDCDCTATGAYVSPDAGVRPAPTALSPGGAFRVEGGALPGPIAIVRQADQVAVLQVQAGSWGWSPDGQRIVVAQVSGTPPNQLQEYALYDLAGGPTTTPVWQAASTLWGSTRLRFSDDGAVFLFAGLEFNSQVQIQALVLATGARYSTTFSFFNPPANFDDDLDPQVAGWGFGPDPTRLAFGYVTGPGSFTRVLANVQTGVDRGLEYTAVAEVPLFSPCGDVFAEKVQQLASSGEVSVALYDTAAPSAAALGTRFFSNGLEVAVRSNASDHVGLLGGIETPIAPNDADAACPVANQPPTAAFTPPAAPVAGAPASFTDASSDPDGRIIAWLWDYGDGATSHAQNPAHVFATAGRYRVRLTVTDNDGATATTEREVVVCANLTARAGRLLFSVDAGQQGDVFNRDLFAYDVVTSAEVQLTDSNWCPSGGCSFSLGGSSGTRFDARYSPDGSEIAFAPGATQNGIWVMSADGSNRRRLTDGTRGLFGFEDHRQPVWSPDGAWIAFENWDSSNSSLDSGLYLVRADGTERVKIPGTLINRNLKTRMPDFFPWIEPGCLRLPAAERAPGCYRLAYVRRIDGTPPEDTIWSTRGDGSETGVLMGTVGIYDFLRVAPDGARLALGRQRFLQGPFGLVSDRGVYLFDLQTPEAALARLTPDDRWAEHPVWSPDGTLLAYQTRALDENQQALPEADIAVTDTVGCAATALLGTPAVEERPLDWEPGAAVQGPVSLAGRAVFGGDTRIGYGGIVLALSGDVTASATTAADGSFRFEGLPAGGRFVLTVVSAPGFLFDPTPIPIELGGHAVGLQILLTPDVATIEGIVLLAGQPLPGLVVRAEGPGGPFEATTDADGRYVLTTRRDQTYTLSGRAPGYRLDPATRTVWVGTTLSLDLTAIAALEGRVAFTSDRDGDEEIYLLDLETGAQTNLTESVGSDRDPAWSPDGARIAFTSARNGFDEIFLVDGDGANPSGTGVSGFHPAWSPDGRWIAYATGDGIAIYEPATGSDWPVTFDPSDARPTWGTDDWPGIVFERTVERDGAPDRDLFAVDVALGMTPPSGLEYPVSVTPEDELEPDLVQGAGETGFALVRPAGSPPALGVEASFPSRPSCYVQPARNPSWSPDGRFIAYDDGEGSLYVFEPSSCGPPVAVTDTGTSGPGGDRDPDWQPVPEPAHGAALAAVVLGLMAACRRRARCTARSPSPPAADDSARLCRRLRRLALAVLAGLSVADPASALFVTQTVTDGVNGVDGLNGVRHIAVSPDERHLYAAGNDDSAIAVFSIGNHGLLAFSQVRKDDSAGGPDDGLQTARHFAISPDGTGLVVAAYNEFAASAFARDPVSGALTFAGEVPNPACCSVFTSLNEVAVSPDGADAYTVSNGYAAALARGPGGTLSLTDFYDVANDDFGRGFAVAVSPDGAHVYVGRDSSLEVTARGLGGGLSFVTRYTDGFGGVDGLQGVDAIAISPDGLDVYVGTSTGDRSITHFVRTPGSGGLAFQQRYADLVACPNPTELLFADDGAVLIASCLKTLAIYERDPNTGALGLLLSIPQESLGASEIYSAAVSLTREVIYVASEGTDSIIVVPEPAPGAALAAVALGLLAAWRRRP